MGFLIWVGTASFLRGFAQAELPVVNVFAPTNAVPEGSYPAQPGYFVLTSTKSNGVTLNLKFSGTATVADLYQFFSNNQFVALTSFPTNVVIPPGTNSVTFVFRPAADLLVEGSETLSLTILPGTSYLLGASPEASVEILDRTRFALNATNIFFSLTNSNFALAPTLSFPVTVGGAFQNLLVRMLIDNAVVDEKYLPAPPPGGANTVTMTWTNPVSGPHTLSFVAFNETGATSRLGPFNFNVAFGGLNPAKTFYLLSPSGDLLGRGVIVSRSPGVQESLGFVEFDVPASATNLSGVLKLQQVASVGTGPVERVDVFAYAAGPTNGTDILKLPKEFVSAVEPTTFTSSADVDVTPWIQKFAGQKLGIMFALPDIVAFNNSNYRFSQFALVLDVPSAVDVGPHIHLLEQPPKITPTNLVTIRAEIRDPDSEISRVYLLENGYAIAIDAPPMPYPPGTNVVTFKVNLGPGPHVLSVRAASLGKIALSEEAAFYVDSDANFVPHRWLGSQNNSRSFYVIDAAGRAYVWGVNNLGQLGLGFTNSNAEYGLKHPVTLLPPDGLKFRQIASAQRYAAGLMDDGSIYVWGTNNLVPTRAPTPRGVIGFRSIGAMEQGLVATDERNNVWVNGDSGWSAPGKTGVVVKAAANSYAYDFNGVAYWMGGSFSVIDYAPDGSFYGIDLNGQLFSRPSTLDAPMTLTAEGVIAWRRVFASDTYVLALDDQGRMFAWDKGFFAGRNSTVGEQVSFPPGVTNFLDVAVTVSIAMALTEKGELYAWGTTVPGMWKDPTVRAARVPELVSGLPNLLDPNATDVAAAFITTSATASGLAVKLESPRGLPITIETSDDLQTWSADTKFNPTTNRSTVTFPNDFSPRKFFRVAP